MSFITPLHLEILKLHPDAVIPTKGTSHSAGHDLYCIENIVLNPGQRLLVKTGLSMSIPTNMYGRIAPRSGWANKYGIDVLGGIIDSDYRGDVGVILINHGNVVFNLSRWSKIAQIIFETYHDPIIIEVKKLTDTNRGENGFGSTGA